MMRLVLGRLSTLGFVLLGLSLVTFIISRLVPTDPARLIAGDMAPQSVVESIRAELGFDRPVIEQYWIYLQQLASGQLGTSIQTGRPVISDLLTYAPATIELAVCALLIAVTAGCALGILSARYQNGAVDHVARLTALLGVSTPSFWLALVLVIVFYGELGVLPAGGRLDPLLSGMPSPTGFMLIDSLLALRFDAFFSALAHLALPAICLGLITMGTLARLVRASLLEELGKPYILTARALGVRPMTIVIRHALPNALGPFVTQLGLSFAALLTGAVVTESIFGWPGLGSYILQAAQSLDFPAIMGFTLFVGVIYVLINLLIDLVYLWLNPELREAAA